VGARRALALGLPGIEENVGLIGVHLPGTGEFIELVPWAGEVVWDVEPWGKWMIRACSSTFEAVIEATCKPSAGTVLRAPTIAQGLAPFCKDTFFGRCRLQVWRRDAGFIGFGRGEMIVDAISSTAALEIGGGPWWTGWSAAAEMKEPLRTLVQLPIDVAALGSVVPGPLRPPGL
jgi:tocopherol cyclase